MPTITSYLDFLCGTVYLPTTLLIALGRAVTLSITLLSLCCLGGRSRSTFTYSLLLRMLAGFVFLQFSSENQEVWEESLQCVSLLVQLYGGDGDDCLSPSCLRSFEHLLRAQMQTESLRIQRTALRIIKRLVSSPHMACRHTRH